MGPNYMRTYNVTVRPLRMRIDLFLLASEQQTRKNNFLNYNLSLSEALLHLSLQRRRREFDIGEAEDRSTECNEGVARWVRGHAPPGNFLNSTFNFLHSGVF